ncbi:MAG: cobalamin-dependent protein, partial [Armatimonadetes bacterium]|nr:cobalamin-dependent protein [Armatimonadota bacterium]
MSSEVLLINTNRLKPAVGPIGLDYVSDCLKARGIEPRLLDLCLEGDPVAALDGALSGSNPLLVGMTLRNTDDCYLASGEDFVPTFSDFVKEVRKRTEAPIVIGGGGCSLFPEAILDASCADYGIAGDGEIPLADLAAAIACGDDVSGVPGLVWRDGRKYRQNPPWTGDISALPERRRSLVD